MLDHCPLHNLISAIIRPYDPRPSIYLMVALQENANTREEDNEYRYLSIRRPLSEVFVFGFLSVLTDSLINLVNAESAIIR